MDHEPEEILDWKDNPDEEKSELTLIDMDIFFDLLMEQQEQM